MPTLCKTALKIFEYRRDFKSMISFNREMKRDIYMSVRRQLPGSVHDEGTSFRLNLAEECAKFIKMSQKIADTRQKCLTASGPQVNGYQMRLFQDMDSHKNHARDFCKYIYCHATIETACMMLTHEKFSESIFNLLKMLKTDEDLLLCGELLVLVSAFAMWEVLPNLTQDQINANHTLCLRAIQYFNDNLNRNHLEFSSIALLTKLSFISRTRNSQVLKNADPFETFLTKAVELVDKNRNNMKFMRLLSYAFICMPLEHLKKAFTVSPVDLFTAALTAQIENCAKKTENNNEYFQFLGFNGEMLHHCQCKNQICEILWYLSCTVSWLSPDRKELAANIWTTVSSVLDHIWVQDRRMGLQYEYCMIAIVQLLRNIAIIFPSVLHMICDSRGAELTAKLQHLFSTYLYTQREIVTLQRATMGHNIKFEEVHANHNCVCLVNCINSPLSPDITLATLLTGSVSPNQCIKIENITGVKSIPRFFGDYGDSHDN